MGNLVAAKKLCIASLRIAEPAELQTRQTLLANILTCLGDDAGALQQCLLIIANGPVLRWWELTRSAREDGALELMALLYDIDLQVRNYRVDSGGDKSEETPRTDVEVRHHGIRCDGCLQDGFGRFRHQCTKCGDLGFCDELFFCTKRESHKSRHNFVKYLSELYPRLTEAQMDSMMAADS